MKNILPIVLISFIVFSCNRERITPSVSGLLEVEKAFSNMSIEKGMVAAFNYYADEEVVVLRDNSYPIVGNSELAASMESLDDSSFTLSWEVTDAKISESGDIGYTYGIYTMKSANEDLPVNKGTYVTIWKKNKEGDWRFVLDTGQDGLGEE